MRNDEAHWLEAAYEEMPKVLTTFAQGEVIMLDLDTDRYLSLNGVGTRIWQMLTQGMTGQQIVQQLVQEYDVSLPAAERDVTTFLQQLAEMEIIQPLAQDQS